MHSSEVTVNQCNIHDARHTQCVWKKMGSLPVATETGRFNGLPEEKIHDLGEIED